MIVTDGQPLYRSTPRLEQSLRISLEMLALSIEPGPQLLELLELLKATVGREAAAAGELFTVEGGPYLELTLVQPLHTKAPHE